MDKELIGHSYINGEDDPSERLYYLADDIDAVLEALDQLREDISKEMDRGLRVSMLALMQITQTIRKTAEELSR